MFSPGIKAGKGGMWGAFFEVDVWCWFTREVKKPDLVGHKQTQNGFNNQHCSAISRLDGFQNSQTTESSLEVQWRLQLLSAELFDLTNPSSSYVFLLHHIFEQFLWNRAVKEDPDFRKYLYIHFNPTKPKSLDLFLAHQITLKETLISKGKGSWGLAFGMSYLALKQCLVIMFDCGKSPFEVNFYCWAASQNGHSCHNNNMGQAQGITGTITTLITVAHAGPPHPTPGQPLAGSRL